MIPSHPASQASWMVVVKGYGSTRNVTRSMMDAQAFFAVKRMAYGGYKVLVDA